MYERYSKEKSHENDSWNIFVFHPKTVGWNLQGSDYQTGIAYFNLQTAIGPTEHDYMYLLNMSIQLFWERVLDKKLCQLHLWLMNINYIILTNVSDGICVINLNYWKQRNKSKAFKIWRCIWHCLTLDGWFIWLEKLWAFFTLSF